MDRTAERGADGVELRHTTMIKQHWQAVGDTLVEMDTFLIVEAVRRMANLIKNAEMTYVIGNGGSAATAGHFAADLSKAARLPVMSLLDNLAGFTAWANDEGLENGFRGQLQRLQRGDNEVLVAISTSGQSANVVQAARGFSGAVIALTGASGGMLTDGQQRQVVEHIAVPAQTIEVVEDCHTIICHSVVRMLKDGFRSADGVYYE